MKQAYEDTNHSNENEMNSDLLNQLNTDYYKSTQALFMTYCIDAFYHNEKYQKKRHKHDRELNYIDMIGLLSFAIKNNSILNKDAFCLFNIAKLTLYVVMKNENDYTAENSEHITIALTYLNHIRPAINEAESYSVHYFTNELDLIAGKLVTLKNTRAYRISGQYDEHALSEAKSHFNNALSYSGNKSTIDNESMKIDIIRFLIKQGCFEVMLDSKHTYGKEENNYVIKSLHDNQDAIFIGYLYSITIVGMPIGLPVLLTALITSTANGIIDSTTRAQISPEAQIQLYCHLSKISKELCHEQQAILDKISACYKENESTFFKPSKQSQASGELISNLNDLTLNASQKWDYVVDYATDMTRNNGKKLFLIINDMLVKKLGTKAIIAQQEINESPTTLNVDEFYSL